MDFKDLNSFLSDHLYMSGLLAFPTEHDKASYPSGKHCYVLCPVCKAKASTGIIKGTRRFQSWQCTHLQSSSPIDYWMLFNGITDLRRAINMLNKIRGDEANECRVERSNKTDGADGIREKNMKLADEAFRRSDTAMLKRLLEVRGIEYDSLAESIKENISYVDGLRLISQRTGRSFFSSGILFRNKFKGSMSFTLRKTECLDFVRSDYRVLQIGGILPFGLESSDNGDIIAITEGAFDCLTLDSLGYPSFSISGVANARKVPEYLPPETKAVITALDNDRAGREATERLCSILGKLGIRHAALVFDSNAKDVNDWLQQDRKTLIERMERTMESLRKKRF